MTPLDVGLAAAGWLATRLDQRLTRRGSWVVVIALVIVSSVWTYLIGSSPRPTDLTFEDVRTGSIPAMTSWVRLEGDLRAYQNSNSLYELHDVDDPTLYVVVISDTPLTLGRQVMTGHISPSTDTGTGNIGSLEPDIPPVPKQNEPFAIIWLPAAIAIAILVGRRLGYPVVRRERPKLLHAPPLAPGETVRAARSGRIGNEDIPPGEAMACAVEVRRGDDAHDLVLTDSPTGPASAEPATAGSAVNVIRLRRSVPIVRLRICRVTGCDRGILIHAQAADLILVFGDRAERDRVVTTLG
jgi:hypothetical protein